MHRHVSWIYIFTENIPVQWNFKPAFLSLCLSFLTYNVSKYRPWLESEIFRYVPRREWFERGSILFEVCPSVCIYTKTLTLPQTSTLCKTHCTYLIWIFQLTSPCNLVLYPETWGGPARFTSLYFLANWQTFKHLYCQ